MQQSPSQEANSFSASQEIHRVLWLIKVHHRVHKSSPIVPIVSHINPVQALYHIARKSILILPSNLRVGLPSGLFPYGFPTKTLSTTLLSPVLPRDPPIRQWEGTSMCLEPKDNENGREIVVLHDV